MPGVDSAAGPVAPADGAGFAEQLDDVEGGQEAGAASPLGDLDALAQRIDRGELAPDEAMRILVDRVLDSQLGPDSPVAIREQARTFVQEALASDPHLIALTRRLEGGQ